MPIRFASIVVQCLNNSPLHFPSYLNFYKLIPLNIFPGCCIFESNICNSKEELLKTIIKLLLSDRCDISSSSIFEANVAKPLKPNIHSRQLSLMLRSIDTITLLVTSCLKYGNTKTQYYVAASIGKSGEI